MSDPNRSMSEVPALLEERRRYEAWLATLESRRESTPQHVFDRVKADYSARLQRVDEQLALHRHSIQEERTSLNSRRSLLEAEEQLRRDERFELELRSHVGEFAGSEAEAAFQAVDEALAQLASERQGLDARIKELDVLLAIRPPEPHRVAPPPRPAAPPAAPAMRVTAPAPAPAMRVPAPAPVPAPPPAHAVAPAPVPVAASNANGAGDEEEGKLRTPNGTFDELAFLSEVVGMPEAERARARVSAEPADHGPVVANGPAVGSASVIPGVRTDAAAELSSENARGAIMQQVPPVTRPLGANIASNTPIVLRTQNEQAKTLKCNECGSLNYPTEWYCERCGAELAAL